MEVTSKNNDLHYSLAQLAELRLPNFPTTERGFRGRVEAENWQFREVKARGRKGTRREYLPPAGVQALIESMQRGETKPTAPRSVRHKTARLETAQGSAPAYDVEPQPPQVINVVALAFALEGMLKQAPPGTDVRIIARRTAEFYNQLLEKRLITPTGVGDGGVESIPA